MLKTPTSPLVYFVDDNPLSLDLFVYVAKRSCPGVSFKTFYSGNSLLRTLNKDNTLLPDLIFLDHRMPGLSGIDTLERIKVLEGGKSLPVVIFSSYTEKELKDQARELGALDLIKKPYDLETLETVIKALVKKCCSLKVWAK